MFYVILLSLILNNLVMGAPQPRDCLDLFNSGEREDKKYTIYTQYNTSLTVRCDMTNGGWTVIARKTNQNIFYKAWHDYKIGFGNVNHSYWIGLDNMNVLTWRNKNSLRIGLSKTAGVSDRYFIVYDNFIIGSEDEKYKLYIGNKMYGNLDDWMNYQNGMAFSTYDSDNDNDPINCALRHTVAGWFNNCYRACLTCTASQWGNWFIPNDRWYYFNYFEMKIKRYGDLKK